MFIGGRDRHGKNRIVPSTRSRKTARGRFPQVLVMGPTRELVLQVHDEAKRIIGDMDVTLACIYGGEGFEKQIRALQKGAQIVVGTPAD